ncbi:hypothetical protein PAPYR_5266 [Paratrimastix pyriformis]|uniref:Uncharacterized protein n=1 Tax=Paratrimastix pyriformis TaxID=342808 RepID=A0ABQ8UMP0_9EUKA|nr:hypothetical protein PAPYR_5266 [Paratrimastix pyriformis]
MPIHKISKALVDELIEQHGGSANVKKLILARNEIRKIEGLERLSGLSFLDISSNYISRIENLPFADLRVLNLSSNRITSLTGLEALTGLEELNLAANSISDLTEIKRLLALPNLRTLVLQGNPCSVDSRRYRMTVLTVLPTLGSLDYHTITEEERRYVRLALADEAEETRPGGESHARVISTRRPWSLARALANHHHVDSGLDAVVLGVKSSGKGSGVVRGDQKHNFRDECSELRERLAASEASADGYRHQIMQLQRELMEAHAARRRAEEELKDIVALQEAELTRVGAALARAARHAPSSSPPPPRAVSTTGAAQPQAGAPTATGGGVAGAAASATTSSGDTPEEDDTPLLDLEDEIPWRQRLFEVLVQHKAAELQHDQELREAREQLAVAQRQLAQERQAAVAAQRRVSSLQAELDIELAATKARPCPAHHHHNPGSCSTSDVL